MASTANDSETKPSFYDPFLKLLSSLSGDVLLRLKARSPQLVPLVICSAALPILLLFSFVAGWIVWSTIPQGWNAPVYLQYGDNANPFADLEIISLSTSQPYEISLQLTVPAIGANYALGNFMTSLRITTPSNDTIAEVRRPAIVLPPSPSILPLARSPRLVQVTVPLVSSLVTGVNRVRAHIELGRRDGWRSLGPGEGRELSVHTTSLRGIVRPQGLRRVVAAAPLSFAIAGAVAFFIVSAFVLAGCLLPSVLQGEPAELGAGVKKEEAAESPAEEPTIATRLRRRSSHVKEESDEGETFFSPHPESESRSEVRRRLRRSSTDDND